MQYNLRFRIRKVEEAPTSPIDLDDIDPYSDWTSQEQPPLFTKDNIYDLERQAMEEEEGDLDSHWMTLRTMRMMRSHCQCQEQLEAELHPVCRSSHSLSQSYRARRHSHSKLLRLDPLVLPLP